METTQHHTHPAGERTMDPEEFAKRRASETDRKFADLNDKLHKIAGRLEDMNNVYAEFGSKVLKGLGAQEPAKDANAFVRGVHWLDQKLSAAAPYLRVATAVTVTGGAVYGGYRGVQHLRASRGAKMQPVGAPVPVQSGS